MKVAIVHDYIKEFGGAERVLKALAEIYPKADIYTAFCVKNSTAEKEFRGKEVHESWLAPLLKIGKLYSPLRFLIPVIWGTMDLSRYDLVITSSSWYVTRGFKTKPGAKVICYCHTPPRWLYGYEVSVGFTKYWPVRLYATIVGHFIRLYDFQTAQKVDKFIANSENVKQRIKKFYRRDAVVIYPPVDVKKIIQASNHQASNHQPFFLIVSRLVGAKGIESAIKAFENLPYKLKIIGEGGNFEKNQNVEFLGRLSDEELYKYYVNAKGFIALARDEDFGMTVVESQAAGTPVIAFNGGGFKESVVHGKTGLLIDDTDKKTIQKAVEKLMKTKWDKKVLQQNAMRFSKEKFIERFKKYAGTS